MKRDQRKELEVCVLSYGQIFGEERHLMMFEKEQEEKKRVNDLKKLQMQQ